MERRVDEMMFVQEIWKQFLIWWYRREAQQGYWTYHRTADDYDCGSSLLLDISTSAIRAAERYDSAMRKLRELDPEFPEDWEPILGEPS